MITQQELLQNNKLADLSPELQANLAILLQKINKVRILWNKPMTITSCLRSKDDQIRIYKAKGITDINKIPMKSKHFFMQAVDIADPTGELYKWSESHEKELLEIGLWCEKGTVGWVHYQTTQYGSWAPGKSVFFNP